MTVVGGGWGGGWSFVTCQIKTFEKEQLPSRSIKSVAEVTMTKATPILHPKSSCLGSQTDLLALELCTAPYCPPGHNKHKCLESPEWKLGLFLNRHRSRPQLVHREHLGPMLYELMKDPSSREVNH